MSSLDAPAVSALLKELFARADRDDEAAFGRVQTELDRLDGPPDSRRRAELMRDVYMPVSPDVGRLLYMLARNRRAQTIVEFGTSFGISGIYLAAALRDEGRGRLVTTELDPIKADRAAQNFRDAGLAEWIEIRVGDAFETLASSVGGNIDLLLLDGWKSSTCRCSNFSSRNCRGARWWWPTISRSRRRRLRPTSTTYGMPPTIMCR
jgi:predicted O-methyltransferase YrrM